MYPTKEEILQALYLPTQQEIDMIAWWKNHYYKGWKNLTNKQKFARLKILLIGLTGNKTPNNIPELEIKPENNWSYIFTKPAIIQAPLNNPSIISLLHELGHHLHGTSELKACRYSIGIFKTCFNKAYNQLIWEKHMLKKQI